MVIKEDDFDMMVGLDNLGSTRSAADVRRAGHETKLDKSIAILPIAASGKLGNSTRTNCHTKLKPPAVSRSALRKASK
jgi:hypothetical protein